MLVAVDEAECAVLEMRDVDILYKDGEAWAPAWAAHLAAAEVHDWWSPNAPRALPWPQVWPAALADLPWRLSTEQMVTVAADKRDPFFRGWVDMWLARTVGGRCYGEPLCVLRRVRPREQGDG